MCTSRTPAHERRFHTLQLLRRKKNKSIYFDAPLLSPFLRNLSLIYLLSFCGGFCFVYLRALPPNSDLFQWGGKRLYLTVIADGRRAVCLGVYK